ncbi:cytosolic Fe-S cluster assembly factor narfl-like [Schistocerca gregaria]|uniref:cytosolic Fe-S cluster assembly factor narfl-like n=1 Tax=Schistocerca gregaria TaxID=7010 RepID=UPI00211E1B23|nr:cytosolic Fe-S cluster assembly factor narfl-like [Schistocerca gregaria]
MDDSFKFSSALRILNTNDYLAPSKSCIKSKDGQSKTQDQQVQINDLHLNSANISTSKKIQISLNDCLACSGCVTTSENMLIEAQNVQEFFRLLDLGRDPSSSSPFRIFVISVSSQALSSIAASTRNSLMEVYFKLHTLFIDKLHCDFFFDTNLSQDIALLECQLEFLESFKQTTARPALPILTSACPGWVCYAEKTHGSWILPHLSLVKSPQQILGTLVKFHLVQRLNDHRDDILCSGIEKSLFPIEPRNICHVTLMQCFDKKLEASRSDFYNKSTDAHDVDLVLTPVELDQILSHIDLTFNELVPSDISKPFFNHLEFATVSSLDAEFSADPRNLSSVLSKDPKESSSDANRRDTPVEHDIYGQDCANEELRQNTRLFGVSGSSGSFAEHVFRKAALELFGVLVDDVPF